MGANQDSLQGAVIGILAVMGTLLNGTLNRLVCMTVHNLYPPYLRDGSRFPKVSENIHFIYAYD